MNVQIRTRGIPVTEGLRSHVERRADFALDRFAERVTSVTVRFADANGHRGGVDKVCRVEVALRESREREVLTSNGRQPPPSFRGAAAAR